MMHATGFHGRCWLPLAPALTDDFSVWAVDQRGHGAAGKDSSGRYDDWGPFVDDLFSVLEALGESGWRGVGHSMGGAVLLLADALAPGTFVNLCCYEPVVYPAVVHSADGFGDRIPMAELARKRRASFPSRQAAIANFAAKPPFDQFERGALEAYVNYGFVDQPDGTVTLACRREDEASVYEGAPTSGAWDRLGQVRAPVLVMGGRPTGDLVSQIVEDVARQLPRGGVRRFPELGHFGPFENPDLVGGVMAQALEAVGPP
jgi:pimeloyl-ACP methyl ester carboxylesterase